MSLLMGSRIHENNLWIVLRFILSFAHIFLLFHEARSTHQSIISMGDVLPPISDDLFLERILKVIQEGTFNEVIA